MDLDFDLERADLTLGGDSVPRAIYAAVCRQFERATARIDELEETVRRLTRECR